MGPYEESSIEVEPISVSVHKRPSLYFMNLDDGTGYAIVVQELVNAVLSWKVGANISVTLQHDRVEVACHSRLPDAAIPVTFSSRRPFYVLGQGMASLGLSWLANSLHASAVVCRQAKWELRDCDEEQSALFDEGICRDAKFAAPDLPESLCFRVSLSIGTERLPFTPATLEQVIERVRYMDGPAEAGYWGCVTLKDERTGESRTIVITDPSPLSSWRRT